MGSAGPWQVDLRPLLPPVQDQGGRNTCLAFAVTAGHEVSRACGMQAAEDLAEEVLYWGCKQIEGNYISGTTFPAAAVALKMWGQPKEALWPYDGNRKDQDATYCPPMTALQVSVRRKAQLQPIAPTVLEIKQWLDQANAVAIGIPITYHFMRPTNGWLSLPRPGDASAGGHALLAVGYGENAQPGQGFLILRNSWGTGWGVGGYGYLPYTYISQPGVSVWTIAATLISSPLTP